VVIGMDNFKLNYHTITTMTLSISALECKPNKHIIISRELSRVGL
jgi:hypothetical protein